VAAVLGHPRTLAEVTDQRPWDAAGFGEEPRFLLRVGLLNWLGSTAWDANEESPDGYEVAIEAFRTLRPTLYDAIQPFLAGDELKIRDAALAAVLPLLASPELAHQAEAPVRR
jgi:glutathione S-transferase